MSTTEVELPELKPGDEIHVQGWPGTRGKTFIVTEVREDQVDARDADQKLHTFPRERCYTDTPVPETAVERGPVAPAGGWADEMTETVEATEGRARRSPQRARELTETWPTDGELVWPPIELIDVAEDNPRGQPGDLAELVGSIQAHGVLEPLVAMWNGQRFLLVAGARRLAAAKLAFMEHVPVIVCELDEVERQEVMLVENLQREDLSPLQEARAFARLLELPGYTQAKLSERLGRSQGHVSKRLALLELPEKAHEAIAAGVLNLEQAYELSKIADAPEAITRLLTEDLDEKVGPRTEPVERWEVERAVRDAEGERKMAERRAELEAAGVKITDHFPGGKAKEIGTRYGVLPHVKRKDHIKEPCHLVFLQPFREVHYCTKPEKHPAPKGDASKKDTRSPKQREEDERRKALVAAAVPRRDFVKKLLEKRLPKDADEFVRWVLVLAADPPPDQGITFQLLGVEADAGPRPSHSLRGWIQENPAQLARAAFASAASIAEWGLDPALGWYEAAGAAEDPITRRYFELLERQGYGITELERAAFLEVSK